MRQEGWLNDILREASRYVDSWPEWRKGEQLRTSECLKSRTKSSAVEQNKESIQNASER